MAMQSNVLLLIGVLHIWQMGMALAIPPSVTTIFPSPTSFNGVETAAVAASTTTANPGPTCTSITPSSIKPLHPSLTPSPTTSSLQDPPMPTPTAITTPTPIVDAALSGKLFGFGEAVGDGFIAGDDMSLGPFTLTHPIIFYGREETLLYVSTNGLITFRFLLQNDSVLEAFPLVSGSPPPLVAPYWGNLNFRGDDDVREGLYARVINRKDAGEDLYNFTKIVHDANPSFSDFVPELMVVATWFKPEYYPNTSIDNLVVFQAILLTDGNSSFAAFIYAKSGPVLTCLKCQVGFDAGDRSRSGTLLSYASNSLPVINPESVFRIDGECVTLLPSGACGIEAVADFCEPSSFTASTCICKTPGTSYNISSKTCKDTNECDSRPCHANAQCINTGGSFECVCNRPGFSGDGIITCDVSSQASVNLEVILCVILFLAIGVILLVVVFCSICYILYRKRRRRATTQHVLDLNGTELRGTSNDYFRNLTVRGSFIRKVPKALVIASSNLKIENTIGQGEFGIVYKGFLRRGFLHSYSELVAVKTLKGFMHKELVNDLLKECVKMQHFDHPNVLKLVGVCLDGGPAPYIIMPFMANGSLLSYLKQEHTKLVMESAIDELLLSEVESKLLDMCVQVAKGMEYLASQRIVHRDLAARNCMIDAKFLIKVADFGLTETIDSSKAYFRQSQECIKLPLKWLALESINDGVFSEKSDVWAFGVTCWEVFSGGRIPYPGIHPLELSCQLEAGYRMEKPVNAACSEKMYQLMKSCWEAKANLRPSFSQLLGSLGTLLESMADYLDFRTINKPCALDATTTTTTTTATLVLEESDDYVLTNELAI